MAPLLRDTDPLALVEPWPCEVPLTGLEEALERSVFRSGLSRADWLKRLAEDCHKPQLLPLLWLLPSRWKLAPAQLPARLQALAGLLERGLLTPALLAALADDLPHLLPPSANGDSDPLALWSSQGQPALPQQLQALLASSSDEPADEAAGGIPTSSRPLSGGLLWHNVGLHFEQAAGERRRNGLTARVLNRLGANRLQRPGSEASPWSIDGCSSSGAWLQHLQQQGWQAEARLRCSVASFGLGASLPLEQGGWSQVPLALPIRTGLLGDDGQERRALLPHSCLELNLRLDHVWIRLQYYQGTEGLCGWAGLNDLHRPWQNDRHNGTVRYLGETYRGERLLQLLDLCEVIALVHNIEASEQQLVKGGYGSLGFCIDSSALIQQVMEGRCQLFPVLMGGIWRERLLRRSTQLKPQAGPWLQAYHQALLELPHDGSLHGNAADEALQRLRQCQPISSPFALVQQLTLAAPPQSPEPPAGDSDRQRGLGRRCD
ncbi:hypothetical protein KUL97_02555 [Synechococcus sp. HK05]|uniref:hypothetical protein n=1 Tax=Synechococcus sp. HK05 TaxID=2725975 RepID=UPI001C395152|nr:hypothetical protein [Synechococcus sp. HK05]MBV2350584.1 hypothetical protein [Synechococcus sp. HK05]